MLKFNTKCWSMFCLLYICLTTPIHACTAFNVTSTDGTVVVARTLEFALELKSNLRSAPRGREFKMTGPDGKPAIAWTGKYAYMYMDGLQHDVAIDGMNERGLSFEALFMPGFAEYQPVGNDSKKVLPYIYFGDWILSNFANVEEVRNALKDVVVVAAKIPGLGDTMFPLHYSFHDVNGNALVVEFVGGKVNVYDNKVGVFTNSPEFSWHLTNLNNYLNLKPTNPRPIVIKGMTFVSTGQGNGMLGLPGDISPPSRFVKMSVFKAVVLPAKDGPSAVNLAEHMINNVDIPFGLAREPNNDNYTSEFTQWTVFKDLKNKKFYFKTYYNPSLRVVDMSTLNLAPKAPMLKMPVETGKEDIIDMTAAFKQSA